MVHSFMTEMYYQNSMQSKFSWNACTYVNAHYMNTCVSRNILWIIFFCRGVLIANSWKTIWSQSLHCIKVMSPYRYIKAECRQVTKIGNCSMWAWWWIVYTCMNNHIYSTLFKIQERKSDRRSRNIEQRKESQNTHTHKTRTCDLNILH